MQTPALEDGSFTLTVRPARVAYLIAEGSREGFRRAVQHASARWGGAREPIIQVPADGALQERDWWTVEHANLAHLVNVDVPQTALDRAIGELREGGPSYPDVVRPVPIECLETGARAVHPADLADSPRTVDGSNGFVLADRDAPLWHAAAAGDLTQDQQARFGSGSLEVRRARHEIEIGEAQVWGHTLLGRTTVSFGETNRWAAGESKPSVLWLADADALADCAGFWNLRALSPVRAASMPVYLLPADIAGWTSFPKTLRERLGSRARPSGPDVVMASATLTHEALAGFADAIGLRRVDADGPGKPRSGQLTYTIADPFNQVMVWRSYGERDDIEVPVMRERITLRFASPVPLHRGTFGAALVGVAGPRLALIPRREATARLLSDGAVWRGDEIVLTDFIAPECRVELRLPTPEEACRAVLEDRTTSHRVGEKAALGMALMNPDTLAALSSPHVYMAINALSKNRTVQDLKRAAEGTAPFTDTQLDHIAQLSGSFKRIFKTASKLGAIATPDALTALEKLAAVGWVERGLATKCVSCGLTEFLPLSSDLARQAARCLECGNITDYVNNQQGITVHYRLDARVDYAASAGVLTHLLAIGTLTREHGPAWLIPGVDLVFPDKVKRETDLFGVCDGRLVCGEVKANSREFTQDQIDKDVDTARRLGADMHIMAAATPINQETRDYNQQQCEAAGIASLVLDNEDLFAQLRS